MSILNVLFCGVGGQGILTSSRILALAAMHAGLDVKMSEVHGMAQRGGNVDTHVRIGESVPSSLIAKETAHYLVAFEKLEALRNIDFLRPDGLAIVCPLEIPPLALSLKRNHSYLPHIDDILKRTAPRLEWVDAEAIARQMGDRRLVNVILLGALARHLDISTEHWKQAIRDRFSPAAQAACLDAFEKGATHDHMCTPA